MTRAPACFLGLGRRRERESASSPPPPLLTLDLVRVAKLLRIKLYTQITSTPTLSHFAGAAGAVASFSRHIVLATPTSDVSLRRGLVTGRI